MRSSSLLLLSGFLGMVTLGAQCPIGPSVAVIADATAELIVTGLAGNETVTVELGGRAYEAEAEGDTELRFFFELEPGQFSGSVVVDGAQRTCGAFVMDVADDAPQTIASIDVSALILCEDLLDLRLFVRLDETITVDPCVLVACETRTSLQTDMSLTVTVDEDTPVGSALDQGTYEALVADIMDESADRLFAGDDPDCPQPRNDDVIQTVLVRHITIDGVPLEESVDATGCLGEAADLAATLATLRQDLLGL